ncbi:acetoacetate--CoA ligase [Agriterribacter sp.]|uniref:acetoacetate--CoA ligase n=1 Tax=Agriterribacter sp. TaxID=2821509 RepID=UPI002C8C6E97|nr:acetoacetate--CoA ligase [Agriterribacter sp.]HRO44225.1 acetoacetate--CoA ligase [Agriterribacter sp.]HRQ18846.1 acetoacetate--CoA ligase [Agriterribacter sp.]
MPSPILWQPSEQFKVNSNLAEYMQWLKDNLSLECKDYDTLWKWSVEHPVDFWQSISDYFKLIHHAPCRNVMSEDHMPHTKWFEGGTLNYAEHIFRNATAERPALLFQSERHPLTSVSWEELKHKVAALQSFFIQQGIQPGDRIAAYLPNIPEATISLLAAMSVGAVWSSCSPDFGAGSVMERFQQIEPRILIAVDGYMYNGKIFNRREEVKAIREALPSVEKLIRIPYAANDTDMQDVPDTVLWDEVMQTSYTGLRFTAVPFDHPVWILYSSGTTGIPKAITHSHGGVLLEHFKYLAFHNDVQPGEVFFWFTTTGWMMWNYLHAALLTGATIVLYDGSPGYPDISVLWRMAANAGVHHFGTSAPFIMACKKAGILPGEYGDLSALRSVSATGSPLPQEGFDYVYEKIKKDLWLCSMSGGTDVCTAFVGGCPLLPVYEGEIQCRALGCDLYALDEEGNRLWNEVGEMVITKPMPSMPVFFWNDQQFEKYLSSYFETYPGIWRHGDWVKITPQNGVVILGRSDATLNRQGVRIGTAEIYRAVDTIPEIKDSLIVNIELPGGGDYMPLFVVMKENHSLTAEIKDTIKRTLRSTYSPRHVPDEIIAVNDIPYTISGKKMEMPVKKILMGRPLEKSVNTGSVKNPESLEFFKTFVVKK